MSVRVSQAVGLGYLGVDIVLDDVFSWLRAHRAALEHVVAPAGHAQQPAPAGGTRQGA